MCSLCADGSLVFPRCKKRPFFRKRRISSVGNVVLESGFHHVTLQSLGCSTLQFTPQMKLGESEAFQDNCRKSVSVYLSSLKQTVRPSAVVIYCQIQSRTPRVPASDT
jgi:hypothetical protein